MKHYRFTAGEAIAWIRICRPGSVIGPQQNFLEEKQAALWLLGDSQRSQKAKLEERAVSHLITSMDDLTLNSAYNSNMFKSPSSDRLTESEVMDGGPGLTQGDKLRALKSRRPPRPATTVALRVEEMKTHSRSASQPLRLSMGAGQGPSSPLKSSKFPASSASAAAKRIGRNPSSTASNIRSSRLASSLSDLYAADLEEDKNLPTLLFLPPPLCLSAPPTPLWPLPLCVVMETALAACSRRSTTTAVCTEPLRGPPQGKAPTSSSVAGRGLRTSGARGPTAPL
ncbi:dual specificity protein phosphatase CDC14AB-like isoform X1 [Micropterus salmoides]|uniref:dual specificity protein phosphatase CDC14AB-like isoform X1 n=1 Tax=Micropterus salmoides TaxID=27706 RepID=UPI0018ED718F|nr:dual specificity protein phosphatase CDC14AB-like isoform X1 [Micropterus salmoides]